ncbi:MAG: pantetheine-phosphate adenylyltransferase [candidate division SR1 bacterium]|nr:pantetheine-phosphate adenylyltransferase [candidate division SR1 bacterium]
MKNALYPGSLDPLTYGHIDIVKRALNRFDTVTLAVGSNPDKEGKNMFSLQERMQLARQALIDVLNVDVIAFRGMLPQFAYENKYNPIVRGIRNSRDFDVEQDLQRAIMRQGLGLDFINFNTNKDLQDVSSSAAKAILKEQGDKIREYVPLNIKQALEGRIHDQYIGGITGSICSGKSYATDRFLEIGKKNGISVHNLDLDKIGHDIIGTLPEPRYQEVRKIIAETFGQDLQNTDGSIDRKKLGSCVFSDGEKLKKLNEIMHTPIQVRLRREMTNKKGLLLYNASLIAESGTSHVANNNILLFDVHEQLQAERLAKRGSTPEEIQQRISSQHSAKTKADIFEKQIKEDKRGSLNTIIGPHSDEELEQHFNSLLAQVDTFGELRFVGLINRLGVQEDPKKLFIQFRNMYDKEGNTGGERDDISKKIKGSYHKRLHYVDCLNKFYKIKHLFQETDAVECAFLFHDIVYDPRSKTNEEDSAEFAEKILTLRGLSKNFIERVKQLIIATKHVIVPTHPDAKFMLDIDNSILGSDFRTYTQYTKDMRREYYTYTDQEYKVGRSAFLHGLLNKKDIYHTSYFTQKLQDKAEQNIINELNNMV